MQHKRNRWLSLTSALARFQMKVSRLTTIHALISMPDIQLMFLCSFVFIQRTAMVYNSNSILFFHLPPFQELRKSMYKHLLEYF